MKSRCKSSRTERQPSVLPGLRRSQPRLSLWRADMLVDSPSSDTGWHQLRRRTIWNAKPSPDSFQKCCIVTWPHYLTCDDVNDLARGVKEHAHGQCFSDPTLR